MRVCVLIGCVLLSSCGVINDVLTTPAREDAPDGASHYLNSGPNTQVELGADEKTLLQEFAELNQAKTQLETQLQEMRAESTQFRAQLGDTERERDRERNLRLGAEAEFERLAKQLRERDSKLLSMNIQLAKRDQEILRLRINSLQQQLRDANELSVEPANAASPGKE